MADAPDDEPLPPRPRVRGDCAAGPRPCPWVGCRHNLYLEVSRISGHLHLNFPDLEPDQMRESCSLDVAARGGSTLETVGATLNLTRERIRQVEVRALVDLARVSKRPGSKLHAPVGGDRESPLASVQG